MSLPKNSVLCKHKHNIPNQFECIVPFHFDMHVFYVISHLVEMYCKIILIIFFFLFTAGYARDLGGTTNLSSGAMQATGPITHSAPLQPTPRMRAPVTPIQPRPVTPQTPIQIQAPAVVQAVTPPVIRPPVAAATPAPHASTAAAQPQKKPLSLTVSSVLTLKVLCG